MGYILQFSDIIFLKTGSVFKLVQVLFISGIKFIFAPPYSFEMGFNYLQTLMTTTAGGLLGVLFFFYLSEGVLILWRKIFPAIKSIFIKKGSVSVVHVDKVKNRKNKPIFTWKNRFIVNLKRKWGLIGIASLTPVLLSIPLGTFLANRYYKDKRSILIYLSISVVCWSVVVSSIYALF
jgi:hypothetical protein